MSNRRFDIKFYDGFDSSSLRSHEVTAKDSEEARQKFDEWAKKFWPSADFDGIVEIPPGSN